MYPVKLKLFLIKKSREISLLTCNVHFAIVEIYQINWMFLVLYNVARKISDIAKMVNVIPDHQLA